MACNVAWLLDPSEPLKTGGSSLSRLDSPMSHRQVIQPFRHADTSLSFDPIAPILVLSLVLEIITGCHRFLKGDQTQSMYSVVSPR